VCGEQTAVIWWSASARPAMSHPPTWDRSAAP
jgi:hypothetical protein